LTCTLFLELGYAQNIYINEIQSSNVSTIFDHTGNTPDWIEIYNAGASIINLENYGLTDVDSLPLKWTFPSIELAPGSHVLVFASGLDLKEPYLFWETIIDIGDDWKYLVPRSEPPSSWKDIDFDDDSWKSGKSGFGYGDGDDSTEIEATMSVFLRKTITVTKIDDIKQGYLHIDFDDAFVAYLNGEEIVRSNIGMPGIPPAFNTPADNYDHEASLYQGGSADEFFIPSISDYLVEGENVLAIQVHNHSTGSSDLTAIPIFTLGHTVKPGYPISISGYIDLVPIGLHTNFKIASAGEHLFLSDPNGIHLDSVFSDQIPVDISFGRQPDGSSNWVFFDAPTPGSINNSVGFNPVPVSQVQFSIPGGPYQTGVSLQLASLSSEDSIYFTTDGSDPTKNDQLYIQEININNTTTVRARVIREGHIPGKISTHSYLINSTPTLPVVFVTTAPHNLWDEEYGMYVLGDNASYEFPHFGANFWEDWERPANISMYLPNGNLAFQIDAGIKIFGNWSRGHPQKSISIHTHKSMGTDKIKYKIFDDLDIEEFKTIILRNSGNDFNNTMLRDAFCNRVVSSLGLDQQAYRPSVVYLNGEYWGIQNIREKVNEEFIAAHHGIEEDKIDILEGNGQVVRGSPEHYEAMIEYLSTHNLASEDNYIHVKNQMDVDNFIKYQMTEIFIDNRDWPGNNIKCWREREPYGKWRWIMFDSDFGFNTWATDNQSFNTLDFALEPNGPDWPNPPWSTFLLRKLLENTSFRYDFINCFADNLNTVFEPSVMHNHLNNMISLIEPEIQHHFTRWGGNIGYWDNRISAIRSFIDERQDYVRGHIRNQFGLSGLYQLNVDIEGNGQIQLNTIKLSDFPWNGLYFNDVPINLEAIPDPGFRFVEWKGIETSDRERLTIDMNTTTDIIAVFEQVDIDYNQVIINEINYNSSELFDAGDWIELFNVGEFDVNLSGWLIKDTNDENSFEIPEGTIIESHRFLVLCRDTNKFLSHFPLVEIVDGELSFGLSSNGDCVRLFSDEGTKMDEVCYENNIPWPSEANGFGATLALVDAFSNNEHPANWKASLIHGTPGSKNDIVTGIFNNKDTDLPSLKVYPNPMAKTATIEILNPTAEEFSISLFDLAGRRKNLIQNHPMTADKNQTITTYLNKDEHGLLPGIYILLVESGSFRMNAKVLVQ